MASPTALRNAITACVTTPGPRLVALFLVGLASGSNLAPRSESWLREYGLENTEAL